MTAFTVVRFRPKPDRHEEFQTLFCSLSREFAGLRHLALIKSAVGDDYFSVAEWASFDAIVAARPRMSGNLDIFRHTLSEFSEGLGVTDAMSGEAILNLTYDGKVP